MENSDRVETFESLELARDAIKVLHHPYVRISHHEGRLIDRITFRCSGHVDCPHKIKLLSNHVLNTCKLEYHGNHGTIFRPRRRIPYEVLPHIDHLLRLGLSPKDVVNALREMQIDLSLVNLF
jgi:hypothetical protein